MAPALIVVFVGKPVRALEPAAEQHVGQFGQQFLEVETVEIFRAELRVAEAHQL
jgi:hypothetical protein